MAIPSAISTWLSILLITLVIGLYLFHKMRSFYPLLLRALPAFRKAAYLSLQTFTNGYFLEDPKEKAEIKKGRSAGPYQLCYVLPFTITCIFIATLI